MTKSNEAFDKGVVSPDIKKGDAELVATLWGSGRQIGPVESVLKSSLNAAKTAMLDCLMCGQDVPPEFKKQQNAIQRFGDQVDAMLDDGKVKPSEARHLKALGNAFVTGNTPALVQAMREIKDLPNKQKILDAFASIVKSNSADKADDQVKVEFTADAILFSGKGINKGKGKVRISLADNGFDVVDDKGESMDLSDDKKSSQQNKDAVVKRFFRGMQTQFSDRAEKK